MDVSISYFVHGTTLDNEKGHSSGWYDVALSEKGIEQSRALKEQTKGESFAAVFCSDLKRAVDSANLTWADVFPIIIDSRLRECNYGDYNAKASEAVEPMQELCIYKPFPNGESYEDVRARLADFLKSLRKDYDGQSIAIVAHKAPQLALDVLLKGMSWEQAFENDWRKKKAWQPGWEYVLN